MNPPSGVGPVAACRRRPPAAGYAGVRKLSTREGQSEHLLAAKFRGGAWVPAFNARRELGEVFVERGSGCLSEHRALALVVTAEALGSAACANG